jgi:RNA polymerase sigma-70 factor (ECF subfamily)
VLPFTTVPGQSVAIDVGALFRAHGPFVWRVLRHHGVPDRDLEDACQEVFVVAQRRAGEYQPSAAETTWLYAIAWRVASDYRRRAHVRREEIGEPPEQAAGLDEQPDAVVARRRRAARLADLVEELDAEKRAVFVLFEIEELPMTRVAEILGCPLQTAYTRLYAARERVKQGWRASTRGESP